jgi:4-alpha-glucanotransferase
MSAAAVTTHDLPTIAGVLTGEDRRLQTRLGLPKDDAADAAMKKRIHALANTEPCADVASVVVGAHQALSRARSAVVLVALEDAIGSADRPNVPGIAGAPSFRRALPLRLEELRRHPLLRRVAKAFR